MSVPSEILASKFPFDPTEGQRSLFKRVDWLLEKDNEWRTLLIKGYAGTGKTTILSALVQVLPLFNYKYVLIAPTGRAAKVMSSYTRKMAFTIHKKIYKKVQSESGTLTFTRQKNYAKDTVFIVDEASMINEDSGFGARGLLSDLVDFVFSDSSNRLVLIGDDAQLPPVGQLLSPALDRDMLAHSFKLSVSSVTLTEVMRQSSESGVLWNATKLREELANKKPIIKFKTQGFDDLFKMTGERMEDGIRYTYDNFGIENTIIICRSNKNANAYNQYIRQQIHFYESELEVGEILMIVRNNYLFSPEGAAGGFLANGDFVEVMKIVNFEEMYGFRFATLSLRMIDYPQAEAFEAKVILDTLYSESPALTMEQNKTLYEQVREDYADLASQKEQKEALKTDPFLNALQIKFAYAVTCHKAQGGQWQAVFVDQGYYKEDDLDTEYVRWLYTAVTRATHQLFLVNFTSTMFV
ncbi:AAA family ATPase [Fulvivirga sp. M361]|uniref:ATP-dependent DNA helicase n=1 Tax=Fulvivirga sp. M361 TaxID=2594266 RepID=UPI00117B52BA|nr:AAA family ATPase [Fulvivirga sp. M361]TRX49839.1 AAA family ATPase [Fulvivirga sp. M361]